MLSHIDGIMLGLLNGLTLTQSAIYVDFAKTFDKVDHKLILEKLKLYGFPQQLIKWINSFLIYSKNNYYLSFSSTI